MTVDQHITIKEEQAAFLERYQSLGFESKNELISAALDMLKQVLSQNQELETSADLYAQVYAEDEQLQELTDATIVDWE